MIGKISLGKLVDAIPENELLQRFCKRYINSINGDNNNDMHRNGELHWLREVLPNCKNVFDAGANIGEWTLHALEINPNLQIHCFEPSEKTFQRLKSRSFSSQVFLNNIGLSANPGELTLYLFADEAGINSVYRREGLNVTQTRTEQIRVDTLDGYCQQQKTKEIDLLKLDVEGHELEVLKGSSEMLRGGRIKRIQFEYGGTYIDARVFLKDMFDLLMPYGYRLYKIYPKKLVPVECYNQHMENFQYQNWVAKR